ncbi:MAG: hypothetical protein WBH03_17850, partial [Cyclobacteriaceae bacterium]
MQTILFFIAPAASHYMATFQFAMDLKDQGFKVTYAGEQGFEKLVQRQGFEFQLFNTILRPIDDRSSLMSKLLKGISRKRRKAGHEYFLAEKTRLEQLLSSVNPDFAIIDAPLSIYSAMFPEQKAGIIQTMMSTDQQPGIPPLNQAYVAQSKEKASGYVSWLW